MYLSELFTPRVLFFLLDIGLLRRVKILDEDMVLLKIDVIVLSWALHMASFML